jgi:hypothetical protein
MTAAEKQKEIEALSASLKEQASQIQKVSAQVEMSRPAPQTSCVSAIDSNGRTIFVADAHRDDGKRFVLRADEKLIAFVEVETASRGCGLFA